MSYSPPWGSSLTTRRASRRCWNVGLSCAPGTKSPSRSFEPGASSISRAGFHKPAHELAATDGTLCAHDWSLHAVAIATPVSGAPSASRRRHFQLRVLVACLVAAVLRVQIPARTTENVVKAENTGSNP